MTEYERPNPIEEEITHDVIVSHELEQRGNDLICVSCLSGHAQVGYFKPGEVLGKDDNGNYVVLNTQEDSVARAYK